MGSKGEFAPAFVSMNPFGLLNKKKLPKEKKDKAPKAAGTADARQHKKERETPAAKAPPAAEPVVAAPPPKEPTHAPRQSQVHRAKKEEDRKSDRHVSRSGVRGEPAKGGAGKGNWGDQDVTPEVATPDQFPDEAPEAPPAAGWNENEKAAAEGAVDKAAAEEEERKRVEEEAKQMTLEEFRAAKAAEMVSNANKNIRKVDNSQFKNMKAFAKTEEDFFANVKGKEKEVAKEKEKEKAPKKKEEPKKGADLAAQMFTMAPVEGRGGRGRGGRGRGGYEGGRRGRGGYEGGRGGGSGHHVEPRLDDDNMFPALPPKHTEAAAEEAAPAATSS